MARRRPGPPRRATLWAVLLLALAGAAMAVARALLSDTTSLPGGDSVWRLRWEVAFDAPRGLELHLSPPFETQFVRVIGQNLIHPHLRQRRLGSPNTTREITLVTNLAGRFSVVSEFDLHLRALPRNQRAPRREPLDAEQREAYLAPEPGLTLDPGVLPAAPGEAGQGLDARVAHAFGYLYREVGRDPVRGAAEAAAVLRSRRATNLGRARAMVAWARALGAPARMVSGIVLGPGASGLPRYWAEIHLDGAWRAYDAERGHEGLLPRAYVPVNRGGESFLRSNPPADLKVRYALTREKLPSGLRASDRRTPLDVLDLNRLPLTVRATLAALLLLPLGALITAVARALAGVRTYGTFTPTLLAMAVTFADWTTSLVVLGVVSVIGIGGRALLPGFRLSKVPRLGIVFTLVALSMVLAVSLLAYEEYDAAGLVVLLPIVILTSLVDRVYSVADEQGLRVALVRLWWTAVVAALCLLLFLDEAPGLLLLSYPELHFFTVALMLLTAAYRGRRLCDRPLLRWLAEPPGRKPRAAGPDRFERSA